MLNVDASYLWMRQKRIQGSHFCTLKEIERLHGLICSKTITPAVSKVYNWDELPDAHQIMYSGGEYFGNLAVLVQASN
jgi:crotonyl-CoA carboxylase/reductase